MGGRQSRGGARGDAFPLRDAERAPGYDPVVEAIASNDTRGQFLAASMSPGGSILTATSESLRVEYLGPDGSTLFDVSLTQGPV